MGKYIKEHWQKFFGAGLLAILIPLLVASEKSMKSLIDEWFEACSVIVQVDDLETLDDKMFIPISLFVQGDPPNQANLVVAADTEVFTRLEFIHDLESNNRALHPTPGEQKPNSARKNIVLDITPFKSKFTYSFRAHVSDSQAEKIRKKEISYGAFIQFPDITEQNICRVERTTVFNWLVGRGAWPRFIALLLLVIVLTGAVTLLRK